MPLVPVLPDRSQEGLYISSVAPQIACYELSYVALIAQFSCFLGGLLPRRDANIDFLLILGIKG